MSKKEKVTPLLLFSLNENVIIVDQNGELMVLNKWGQNTLLVNIDR